MWSSDSSRVKSYLHIIIKVHPYIHALITVNRGIKEGTEINSNFMLTWLRLSVAVRVNICTFTNIPGIRIVWLHPCSSRTTGDIAETGELLTDPVSVLVVRVPFTRSCQLPPPATREPIQQQLSYLTIRQKSFEHTKYLCEMSYSFRVLEKENCTKYSFKGSFKLSFFFFTETSISVISATHDASKVVTPAAL